jgi:CheY-like chemotaxis protein
VVVFICYRRADSAFPAHALRYALRLAGHDVFLDTGTIAPGEAFRDVIRDSLLKADLVLSLVGEKFDACRLGEPLDPVAFEWRQSRFFGCPVHAVLVDGARMPAEQELPADLRWFCKRSATVLADPMLGQQIDALVAEVPRLAAQPRGFARVLWVDDSPVNNEDERSRLRADGLVFDNVVSSSEAIEQLRLSTYDLVISDLGRRGSSDRSQTAGLELLRDPVVSEGGPPLIVYAGRQAVKQRPDLLREGAFGATDNPVALVALVREALGRRSADDVS